MRRRWGRRRQPSMQPGAAGKPGATGTASEIGTAGSTGPAGAAALDLVRQVWEAQARADPLWAVLSEPAKRGRRWSVDDFFATGEQQVEGSLARFAALGGTLPDRDRALDFGSGVGRLSQPLARRFDHVVGIDISPTMVQLATKLNPYGERVRFIVNDRPDLQVIEDASVSLVFSHITLQHVPPELVVTYLAEFFRVLKPGGALIFQLPSHLHEDYVAGTHEPIPDGDRLASIDVVVPPVMAAGDLVTLPVRVGNRSTHDWRPSLANPLNVGDHWADETGHYVSFDDARAGLPRLGAGESVVVDLPVNVPLVPGRYRLEIDVVQEGVAWFAEGGSEPAVAIVVVAPGTAAHRYDGSEFTGVLAETADAPMFEMHGVPIERVRRIIDEHGAVLLGADEWVTEWHSFGYFVQGGPTPTG